jgi:hypothetical protein
MLLDIAGLFCQFTPVKSAAGMILFLTLAFAANFFNFSQVSIGDQAYFVDGDCYARMTRVRRVLEHPLQIIRHHDFENYPAGIVTHTTAPLDWLIAGLSVAMRPFTANIDWAGAMISPLLGLLTAVFIWFWSKKAELPFRGTLLFLFAISPILGHAFSFGRPNHHALQLLLMAVALGAEWMLWKKNSRAWSVVGGAAFGFGMWVSLYEPLIIFLLVMLLRLFFFRRLLFSRDGAAGLGVCLAILILFFLVEGVTVQIPDAETRAYFKSWAGTISEMQSVSPLSPHLYACVGLVLLATPLLFPLAIFRGEKNALPAFVLLAVLYALSLWQIRWAYFFTLYFAMTLPLQMAVLRRRALVWTVFVIALWPVAREWENRLYPPPPIEEQFEKQRVNNLLMRDAAEHLRSDEVEPIMAPWWTCAALAYWSGQPAAAGSSHESLPGILDSARFFLTDDLGEARAILKVRKIRWVVAYEAQAVVENSSKVLGQPAPPDALGNILYKSPHSAPNFLTFTYQNPIFPQYKIYRVEQARL